MEMMEREDMQRETVKQGQIDQDKCRMSNKESGTAMQDG